MKKCTKCHKDKADEDFPEINKNQKHTHCKECRNRYFNNRYNNPETKARYKENRDKVMLENAKNIYFI